MEQSKSPLLPLFLGTVSVLLLLAGMLGIFVLLPYLRIRALTADHAEEFKKLADVEQILQSAGEDPEIRVLRYGKTTAKLSILSKDGKREYVCTFLREDRAPEITAAAKKSPGWKISACRTVRNPDSHRFSGLLRSYLRMIGC